MYIALEIEINYLIKTTTNNAFHNLIDFYFGFVARRHIWSFLPLTKIKVNYIFEENCVK